jgi:Tol biopolymer transport system component/DNA-binding winged helix-turn-helix (wHTH) protein
MPEANTSSADFSLGDWIVRPSLAAIERDAGMVHVTPRAMAVLVRLAAAGGAVVSRNTLLDAVWPGMSVTPDALSQCVVELRKAFRDDPKQPAVIQTIPKIGLRLLLPVTPVPPVAQDSDSPAEKPRARRRSRIAPAAGLVAAAIAVLVLAWATRSSQARRDPLAGADYIRMTDFIGSEEHGAISRDGRFIAFVSDRDGEWDVFVGQAGTGDFRNVTRGRIPGLRNPSVRMLAFSPDGAELTIWSRNSGWRVPVVGGDLRPGPADIAELDWSRDQARVAYHPAAPGDPLYVAGAGDNFHGRRIYAAAPGIHCHFPLWSRDGKTIYFVQGFVPDEMDLWQVSAAGGTPQRLTWHDSQVSFPVQLDDRTLLYLATSADGSGPWLHALDLGSGATRRVKSASNAYTSLAASADGRRLLVTEARPTASLWRLELADGVAGAGAATRIPIRTQRGVSPRFAAGSLLYRAPKAGTDALWRYAGPAEATELWSGREGRVVEGPSLSPDGSQLAFLVRSRGRTRLYLMNADGRNARPVPGELDFRGSPAWSPDGRWIAISTLQHDVPRLVKLPAAGGPPVVLTDEYALDPAWSPSGRFLVYSTADVGTAFEVHAVGADGTPHALPRIALSRGARRIEFLGADENTLVILKGELSHKEFWAVDLRSGEGRGMTALGPGEVIGDFDVAADGRSILFDRTHEESDIALIELGKP